MQSASKNQSQRGEGNGGIRLPSNSFDAVAFDLDGTMVDNTVYHHRAWQQLLEEFDVKLDARQFASIIGTSTHQLLRQLLPGHSDTEYATLEARKDEIYRCLYEPPVTPLPGLKQFIAELRIRGKRIAVATTSTAANRNFVLAGLSIEGGLDAIIGAEQVDRLKPAPDVFLAAAAALQVPPSRCLAFEDTKVGVVAAVLAGMRVYGLTTSLGSEELGKCEGTISDFTHLRIEE
jgi:beta-phosphoglucomutase